MCFSLNVILVTAATYQDEEELRQHPSNTQQQQHLRLKGKNEKKRDLLKLFEQREETCIWHGNL